jgi:hypothetical protein
MKYIRLYEEFVLSGVETEEDELQDVKILNNEVTQDSNGVINIKGWSKY